MTAWVSRNRKQFESSDFFRPRRNYGDRMKGFQKVLEKYNLQSDTAIIYLEFGVASALSFTWWLTNSKNKDSRFYGFDTFEGLPEDWGFFYKKGAMSHGVTQLDDNRHQFIKGLFQDTLTNFIEENVVELKSEKRKIIHMDADLFSSTLFVLSQLYPYLHKGDVIIFDEFNVPSHEYYAFEIFTKTFYVNLKPISGINNFYQSIFVVD
jgi:O-methyltransferase